MKAVSAHDCDAVTRWWAGTGGSRDVALRLLGEMPSCLPEEAARYVEPGDSRAMDVAVKWLLSYGGRTYVPSRDDRAAVKLLRKVGEGRVSGCVKTSNMLKILSYLEDSPTRFADPEGRVRKEVAHQAALLGSDGESLLLDLFLGDVPPGVALAALDGLVKVGLSSSHGARALLPHLFSVRGGVSWGPLVMAVLASSRGECRRVVVDVARDVIVRGALYARGKARPPEVLAPVYRKARASGWSDGLVESTMVRLLGLMGEGRVLEEVLSSYTTEALARRWAEEHARFLEESGQPPRKHPGASGTPSQLHDIEGYQRDIVVRQALLDELSMMGRAETEMVRGLTFGHDASIAMGSALPLTRFTDGATPLSRAVYEADSWATTSSFFSTVREQALRTALADPTGSEALVKAWNSTKDDARRWRITRKYWEGIAAQSAGVKGCAKSGACLLPTERLREAIMEEAWIAGAPASTFDASRMVGNVPPIPEGAAEDPDFTDVPWPQKVEKSRRMAAVQWIRSKKNELSGFEKKIRSCQGRTVCLVKMYKKAGPVMQRRILRVLRGRDLGALFLWELFTSSRDVTRQEAVWLILSSRKPGRICSRLSSMKVISLDYLRLRLMCLGHGG